MGTKIKSELSKKNPYWVEKHRYYELKHFCLQYPEWKRTYMSYMGFSKLTSYGLTSTSNISDPTYACTEQRALYLKKMELVEQTALNADGDLYSYILKAVTEDRSYNYLQSVLDIPSCRDVYYAAYRRFFWLLDKVRD